MNPCRAVVEVFSRVVGFYRPVHVWNPGKKSEFDARKEYNVNKSLQIMAAVKERKDDNR